jgi:Primase C terminal 2 (PriCT-2)/RepB DNA-primase from phage plasmid
MPDDSIPKKFLSLLDPTATSFTFQTVPEPKDQHPGLWPQVLHGSLNDQLPKLTDLNSRGAAIYVTVNETDGAGRKAENITRIRAIWQDDDCGYGGRFPLPPSIIVSSSPGKFQRYWLADGLSADNYKGLMATMIRDFGSDPQAGADIARVLRVPGFLHNKAAPYLVTILEASGRRYSRDELLKAFPSPEQLCPRPLSFAVARPPATNEETFRIKDALKRIDPDPYDHWIQVGQILHGHYNGQDEGLGLWMEWAQASSKFALKEHTYKWGTFGKISGRPLGLGTLFKLANDALFGR